MSRTRIVSGMIADSTVQGLDMTSPLTLSQHLLFTDNTYDIGASGATRPRNLYLAGNATLGGNLNFGGIGQRITGDMSNATHSNRLLFQSTTTNGNTSLGLIANGTATVCAINIYGSSDPTNASFLQLRGDSTQGLILGGFNGTGSYVPFLINVAGAERMRFGTGGQIGFFGAAGITRPTISGSKGGNAALGSLLSNLHTMGLVTDSTTA